MSGPRSPGLSILAAGVATTIATLLGAHWLGKATDIHVMGLYVALIPFGAIGCGAVAGSGYAIRSRVTGARLG